MTYWTHSDPSTTATCPMPHRDGRERQAADGRVLCHACAGHLRRDIISLPELHNDLLAALASSRSAAGGRVSGTTDPQINLDHRTVAARDHIVVTLCSWARIVMTERELQGPDDDRPITVAPWLLRHADWLAAQEYAAEVAATFRATARDAFSLAYPSGRRTFTVGTCPEDGCDGILTATVARTDDLLPSLVACSSDPPHEWTARQWFDLGRALHACGQLDDVG